jgi:cytochrome c551/c552
MCCHLRDGNVGVYGCRVARRRSGQPGIDPEVRLRHLPSTSNQQPATKLLGPSWKDIGATYGEGKGTAAQLVASIKAGSSGKWGAMPMRAQAQIPDADLQLLAQWLLDGAK